MLFIQIEHGGKLSFFSRVALLRVIEPECLETERLEEVCELRNLAVAFRVENGDTREVQWIQARILAFQAPCEHRQGMIFR